MKNTFGIEIVTSKLPINLENLLRQRQVEGERIETKAGWVREAVSPKLESASVHLNGGVAVSTIDPIPNS